MGGRRADADAAAAARGARGGGRRDAARRRLHRGLSHAGRELTASAAAARSGFARACSARAGWPRTRSTCAASARWSTSPPSGTSLDAVLAGQDRARVMRPRSRSCCCAGLLQAPTFIPEFLTRPDTRRANRAFAGRASLSIDVHPGDASMLIAFFVNDMEREFAGYTTTVLAYEAVTRGHRVCYVTPSDFVLNPDDSLSVHGRFPPKKKYKDRPEFFATLMGKTTKVAGDRHDRGRRADAAQRSVDRRAGQSVGDGRRHPVRARGGQARSDRAQRSRQPVEGDQQALFPELPGRGARRDVDHQA